MTLSPSLLGYAFTLGAATFFAPCAFPLLPGYLAFYLGRDDGERATSRDVATMALLVILGFVLVFGVVGGVAVAAGSRALSGLPSLELVVGAVLVTLGAAMAAGRSPAAHVPLPERRRTPTGFFLFGVVYAVAAAGCSAPLLVGVAVPALSAGPAAGAATLGAFAAGMSAVMVGVTVAAALGRSALLTRLSGATGRLRRAAGVVLVVAGVVQLYYYLVVFDGLSALGL